MLQKYYSMMKDVQEREQQQNNSCIPFYGFLNVILEDNPFLHHHKKEET